MRPFHDIKPRLIYVCAEYMIAHLISEAILPAHTLQFYSNP